MTGISTELHPELPQQIADAAPAVTVVGDAMLDTWVYGTSERLAREAPAPVIDRFHEEFAPGGAANTAMNLAALGAKVTFVSLIGDDASGDRLLRLLQSAGIDTAGVVRSPGLTTTTKSRVIVDDQVMFRLDTTADDVADAECVQLADSAVQLLPQSQALVICDYGTVVHRSGLAQRLAEWSTGAGERPFVVVDAHEPARWAQARPNLATPNAAETAALVGCSLGTGTQRVAAVADMHQKILGTTGADEVIVTLDRDGTALVTSEGIAHRTWANPATEKQASGAGDTFVAALTLARAVSLPTPTAADFGQAAADVVVHRLGTSLCHTEDLTHYLSGFHDALLPEDKLLAKVAEHRARGERIILTNGCFDVLHRGHTAYLNKAKQLGDVLVVAVNDDDSVRRLKGEGRPINPLADRSGVLASLSSVDYVTSFGTDTPIPLIAKLKPDIYVKGGDYTREMLEETSAVEAYGGQVRLMDYVSNHSSTAVVDKMRSTQFTMKDQGV